MKKLLLYFSILLCFYGLKGRAQNNTIGVDIPVQDYGDLENVYSLKSEFIITNNSQKNLYFLRADVEKDVKVLVHKKTLKPGDTTLLEAMFQPASTGKFKREIKLV